jgi:hypothetical protein
MQKLGGRSGTRILSTLSLLLALAIAGCTADDGAREQAATGVGNSKLTSSEREQILAYIRERLAIEVRTQETSKALQEKYANVEIDWLDAMDELVSSGAIETARMQVKTASEMNVQFRSLIRARWTQLDHAARSAALRPDILRQVHTLNSQAFASVMMSIDRWATADTAFDAHAMAALAQAEVNLSSARIENGKARLAPEAEGQFHELQTRVKRADDERNKWYRAAIDARDGVNEILKNALSR